MLVKYLLPVVLSALAGAVPTEQLESTHGCDELTVKAPSGTFVGLINGTAPHVRQFLQIPFAQPPVEARRWLPPQKFDSSSSRKYDATSFPPSCPQYVSKAPSIFNVDVPEWLINRDNGQPPDAGAAALGTSEDCLYLALWAPKGKKSKKLPIIIFMTGGAFVNGGINIEYQKPHHWVERTQSHIVVTINYRLNIMGFPNAAGLEENNLGLLDQRAAIEWVRDNIEAFGGDPDKITLWGQSAGAGSVDFQNFAYPDNPIVKGFVLSSGSSAFGGTLSTIDATHSNFTFVAKHLGCGDLSATAELECMRNVPVSDIQNFVGGWQDNSSLVDPAQPRISFYVVPDNRLVFDNYTRQYELGRYAKKPAIFSTTSNEGAASVSFPPTNATARDISRNIIFLCPAAASSAQRTATGSLTYRFVFSGNFTNVSPAPYLGAYHDADLTMLFGTHRDFRGPSTEYEFAVSESMQDHLLAFMKDPEHGPATVGWEPYSNNQVLVFGNGASVVKTASVVDIDGTC